MRSLAYRDPSPSPLLMKLMGHLNRFVVLPRVIRLAGVDLPAADQRRLERAVNPDTAAFLAPGHPEFMTDWMIDKEISRRFAPMMASWAAQDIVNSSRMAQRFWLANGLIANTPGGGGKAYSLRCARAGRGVLLHPEGAVNWQAERIWPLHPGAIDMATSLAAMLRAEDDPRPVFVVPMVWRLTFSGQVHAPLLAEMEHIESACGLSVHDTDDPAERLTGLLGALLTQRAHQFGLRRPDLRAARPDPNYFSAQSLVVAEIRARLANTYGPLSDDPMHALRAIQRGMRRRANLDPARVAQDRGLMMELHRLSRLDPNLYGRATLTQEHIAEILKATRAAVVTDGFRNALHNLLPRAVARRVVHIRVGEPIDIRQAVESGADSASLLLVLQRRLQNAQDALGAELEPRVGAFRLSNPMALRASNGYATAV